jgi:hypothetical protein
MGAAAPWAQRCVRGTGAPLSQSPNRCEKAGAGSDGLAGAGSGCAARAASARTYSMITAVFTAQSTAALPRLRQSRLRFPPSRAPQVLFALGAVQAAIREKGLPQTPAAVFAACVSALEHDSAKSSPEVRAKPRTARATQSTSVAVLQHRALLAAFRAPTAQQGPVPHAT